MECVGYIEMCEELVPQSPINLFYALFCTILPIFHLVFATIVSFHHFKMPTERQSIKDNKEAMASWVWLSSWEIM